VIVMRSKLAVTLVNLEENIKYELQADPHIHG